MARTISNEKAVVESYMTRWSHRKIFQTCVIVGRFFGNIVVVSMRMRYMCAFLFRRFSVTVYTISSLRASLRIPSSAKGERESVVPANLCIVIGCATKRARGYRDRRGKGGQLDVVCGTGLYRLGGTFLGLNQVRRVAGESDQDREVRLYTGATD